jgi:hypothetical protein
MKNIFYGAVIFLFGAYSCVKKTSSTITNTNTIRNPIRIKKMIITKDSVIDKSQGWLILDNYSNKCGSFFINGFSYWFELPPNSYKEVKLDIGKYTYKTTCSFSENCKTQLGDGEIQEFTISYEKDVYLEVDCY